MKTVETIKPTSPLEKKHAAWISSAIQSGEPGKQLAGLLAEWPHCGSRDCPEQTGMYHIGDAVVATDDVRLNRDIALVIKDILPGLPGSVARLITPGPDSSSDRRYFRSLTTTASVNLIALSSVVKQPDLLADPLESLVNNREVMRMSGSPLIDHATLSAVSKIETDPVVIFRGAVMSNQSDNRYQSDWLDMLAEGRSEKFPVFANEGSPDPVRFARELAVWGLLSMPEGDCSGINPAVVEAGKIISRIPEYKTPADKNDTYPSMTGIAKRDKDFRRILIWSVLNNAGFDESVLKQLLAKKDSLGWEKWAVDSLDYLISSEYTPLSPLDRLYRKAALSMRIENRLETLEGLEGIRSTAQPSSPEHSTLTIVKSGIDGDIDQEIGSWTLARNLQYVAFHRSIQEGWFPDELKIADR